MSRREAMLEREQVANRAKHWVRLTTACNSACLFCLDTDTPRNLVLPVDEIHAELHRGLEELGADKVILSGGEATLHPQFAEIVAYGKSIGYDRVQTVTNGTFLGEKDYYERAVSAGLGEITWSLHGHTEELHDELTQTPGAFKQITRGIARAVRDPRVICNVDVVICKPNVGVLDKIVELAIRLGVTEFDLLHVIPQAAAFDHRDTLFYDPADHIDVLHKVFKLNRHPRFVIWTNRFPVPFLEGLEDLVQDPHKMLDEVNGRRFMVRNYLDQGTALDCRQPERCVHCFIEPFCTTMDRTIARQNAGTFEVWQGDGELPFGATMRGVSASRASELTADEPVYAQVADASPLRPGLRGIVVATRTEQLDAWLPALPPGVELEIRLDQPVALWLAQHREVLAANLDRVRVHQPSHEHMADGVDSDLRKPAAFFEHLALPALRVSGLPACLAPGTTLAEPPAILSADLFDPETGRVSIRPLAREHVANSYRSKSLRCRECRVSDRCDGIHVNMVRDQGLRLAAPLTGAWADEAERQLLALHPEPLDRVSLGRALEPAARSLRGFPEPAGPVLDPLAIVAKNKQEARRKRRLEVLESR